ncbi:MAG: hypothetical protein ACPGJS_05895 [Flammeovirgaceae bacterium]
MKRYFKHTKITLMVILATLALSANYSKAQVFQSGSYTDTASSKLLTVYGGSPLTLQLPTTPLGAQIKSAKLYVKVDLGDDFTFGNLPFQAPIVYTLKAIGTSTTTISNNASFNISNKAPEAAFYVDITHLLQSQGAVTSFEIPTVNFSVEADGLTASLKNRIQNALRLSMSYVIDYQIDVSNMIVTTTDSRVTPGLKGVEFNWSHTGLAPNYQFQLLRLYNTDPTKKDSTNITAEVDWNKALSLEMESHQRFLKLTMAEGTGYYIWRVRPIGNLCEGGIANPCNYGKWSNEYAGTISLNGPSSFPTDAQGRQVAGFFYEDPDDQLNFVYGRTFSEQGKIKETVTYANGLQQVRQKQTRIPSDNTTVTAQTIYDFTGRPRVNTLPVPKEEEGLTGYKKKFVQNEKGELFGAKDFDDETTGTITNPKKIKQEGTDFSYYDGKNSGTLNAHVADAEGYAYTASLYENDGTGRVKEQSGVGRKHMIGNGQHGNGGGKTLRTFYEQATEAELIRLFGDEAPDHKSVMKTITLDQNNVGNISYTSKEGKVIASCLIALDHAQDSLLPLKDSATEVLLEDKITGNYQSFNKIASSKRMSLLEQKTLFIDYISDCNSSSNCEYTLTVLIKKIDGKPFTPVNEQSSGNIAWLMDNATTQGYIISQSTTVTCGTQVTFNDISLPAGAYIIEKQLVPTAEFYTRMEMEKEAIGEKTTPFVNLMADWIDEIVCSKDVAQFYARMDTLNAGLKGCFVGTGNAFGPPASLAGCTFTTRDTTYYKNLDAYYQKLGLTWDTALYATFFTPMHQVKLRRGFEIIVNTPECAGLTVPLDFQDVIDCSDVSLALTDKNKTYNDVGGTQYIAVNPFMFLDKGLIAAGNEQLVNTEFSPDLEGYAYGFFWDCTPEESALVAEIDSLIFKHNQDQTNTQLPSQASLRQLFENEFHIYMGDEALLNAHYIDHELTVKEILGVNNLTHARNKVIFIYLNYLVPYMKGYEVPGTFNLMAHHMLTDEYTTDGFTIDALVDDAGNDRELVYNGPAVKKNDCGDEMTLANGLTPTVPEELTGLDKIVSQQYYCDDLYNCWSSQLGLVKAVRAKCPNTETFDFSFGEPPYSLSDRIDEEEGDHDNHFDDNIKLNWILKLFLGKKIKKISKKVRTLQVNPADRAAGEKDEDTPFIPIDPKYHIVGEFLNCTGYKFAKIITESDPSPIHEDVIGNYLYSAPAARNDYDFSNPNSAWYPYSGEDRGYSPNADWQKVFRLAQDGKEKEYNDPLEQFKFINDPIYAFKYYEYPYEVNVANDVDNGYRRLELLTCYKDYEVDDCNICGFGYIQCPLTNANWASDQRYGFYAMLSTYEPYLDTTLLDAQPKDYLSAGYREINDKGEVVFSSWDGSFSGTGYQQLKQDGFTLNGKRLPTKVELDITSYNEEVMRVCEGKRSALKLKLMQIFAENCYEIVPCCEDSISTLYADTTQHSLVNNKVLEQDIDVLVDQMIQQCQERGQIGSFRVVEEGCKFSSNFAKGDVITEVEYGVVESNLHAANTVNFHYRTNLSDNPPNWLENDTTSLTYKDPITGEDKEVINMSNASFTRDLDPSVTYCEWNRRREVMEMEMKINLPNRCQGQPVGGKTPYDAACDPSNPLNPYKEQQKMVMDGAGKYPKSKRNPTVIRLKVTIDKKNQATTAVQK